MNVILLVQRSHSEDTGLKQNMLLITYGSNHIAMCCINISMFCVSPEQYLLLEMKKWRIRLCSSIGDSLGITPSLVEAQSFFGHWIRDTNSLLVLCAAEIGFPHCLYFYSLPTSGGLWAVQRYLSWKIQKVFEKIYMLCDLLYIAHDYDLKPNSPQNAQRHSDRISGDEYCPRRLSVRGKFCQRHW